MPIPMQFGLAGWKFLQFILGRLSFSSTFKSGPDLHITSAEPIIQFPAQTISAQDPIY